MTSMIGAVRILVCGILVLFWLPSLAQGPERFIERTISDRVSSEVAASQSASVFGRLVKLQLSVGETKGKLKVANYQPYNKIFLQYFASGTVVVWDFARGEQLDEFELSGSAVPIHYDSVTSDLYLLKDGQFLRMSRSNDTASYMDLLPGRTASSVALSDDGSWLFVGTSAGDLVKMTIQGKKIWDRKALGSAVHKIAVRFDGRRATALSDEGEAITVDEDGNTKFSSSEVATLGGFDRKDAQALVKRSGEMITVSGAGRVQSVHLPLDEKIDRLALNPSGDHVLAITSNGKLGVLERSVSMSSDSDVKYAVFLGDKRYLYVKSNGVAYLRSMDLDHYLLAIVPGALGWVIVDHEGRYDGTVRGMRDVRWASGKEKLTLDQFFEAYYVPGILSAYVRGQEGALQSLPAKFEEGVYLPPKVELDFPDGKMKAASENKVVVVAQSMGGNLVDGIRVFHNGKRLPPKARIGSQRFQKGELLFLAEVWSFVPEPGANEVFAEVRNSHGLMGRSEVKREVTDGYRSPGRLKIIGVGVDKYRLQQLNLSFATADVTSVVTTIDRGAKRYFDNVNAEILADSKATSGGIKSALDSLRQAGPQDSLVLVLAGHGYKLNNEWYFLPHDVNPKDIKRTGIAARDLQDALVQSPAKRILLTVDACNSGAGIDSFNRYREFQRRLAQQIGRSAGVSVLTATRRDQDATELPRLGHGLFSYVVLQGLDGRADLDPRDGKITAHELAIYVGENLQEKARQLLAASHLTQSPAYFVIGADFPISGVGLQ